MIMQRVKLIGTSIIRNIYKEGTHTFISLFFYTKTTLRCISNMNRKLDDSYMYVAICVIIQESLSCLAVKRFKYKVFTGVVPK